MRISCDADDPGYAEWMKLGETRFEVKVFLDDAEVREVITADEEAGMLVRYRKNDEGRLIVENGIFLRETLYGRVELH